MVMVLGGSGTANGITSFSDNATFLGTLGITGALTQSSGAAFNLASGQLAFPATQNASSNANTLDDYEEGSWTPTIGGAISDPTYTSSQASGVYIKLGRLVHISALIIVTGVSAQGSGGIIMRGLPFSYGGTTYGSQLMIGYNDVWDTAFTNFYLYGGSAIAFLSPTGVTQSNAQYGATSGSASNLSTGYFGVSGSYYANA